MRKNTGAKTFLLAILVGVGSLPASGDVPLFEPGRLRAGQEIAAEVTIYRDHYGVPHDYGPTDASALFGAAYARAEDKLLEDEISILYVLGRSAELDGEEGLAADMSSLFISYTRKDIEFARKLTECFKGQDLDFWIDWEGIPPTVDWWKEIENGIEQAAVFLFLLSPSSSRSKVCKQAIEHAVKNGKRLIPIVVHDIKGEEAPSELRALNWIFLRETADCDTGFNKLITAITTDYNWVQIHQQLQIKALEWDRNIREKAFLLHGKELQDAELQLAANSSREPHPTDWQREWALRHGVALIL